MHIDCNHEYDRFSQHQITPSSVTHRIILIEHVFPGIIDIFASNISWIGEDMLTGLSHITEVRYFDICWIWHLDKGVHYGVQRKDFCMQCSIIREMIGRDWDKSGPKGPWQKHRLEDSLKLSLPKILLFSDDISKMVTFIH